MTKHEINVAICEKFFGWKWVSYVGTPIRGTPGYPEQMRIRMFMSRAQQDNPKFDEFVKSRDAREADMTEPLAYDYCSSGCQAPSIPNFTDDWNEVREVELQIRHWGLWDKYQELLEKRVGGHTPWFDASCRVRCSVALKLDTERFTCMFPSVERAEAT